MTTTLLEECELRMQAVRDQMYTLADCEIRDRAKKARARRVALEQLEEVIKNLRREEAE